MERLVAMGLSWRHDDLERVARFTAAEADRPERARELAQRLGAEELLLLITCNRVEIFLVAPAGAQLRELRATVYAVLAGRPATPGEAERTFRAWSGEGAVEHAFLVATGLDSAQLGETEITGQVRRAAEEARALGLLGPRLGALVEDGLKLARRLRRETTLGKGRTSLAQLAIEALRDRLALTGGTVALVGVSPMTERCGKELSAAGTRVVVVNRTVSRAEAFAKRLSGASAVSLTAFADAPPCVEAVVCATSASGPVLARGALERLASQVPSGRRPLIVDLAVPPDVDPADALAVGVDRIGLETLTERAAATRDARVAAAAEARLLVDAALEKWRRGSAERALEPVLAAVQRHYQATARAGVDRLLERDLNGLGPAERDAVERWADSLARRFAHLPASGLREVVSEHGPEALEAFLRRADSGLALALDDARPKTVPFSSDDVDVEAGA